MQAQGDYPNQFYTPELSRKGNVMGSTISSFTNIKIERPRSRNLYY